MPPLPIVPHKRVVYKTQGSPVVAELSENNERMELKQALRPAESTSCDGYLNGFVSSLESVEEKM
jgi:hypothetical protein